MYISLFLEAWIEDFIFSIKYTIYLDKLLGQELHNFFGSTFFLLIILKQNFFQVILLELLLKTYSRHGLLHSFMQD